MAEHGAKGALCILELGSPAPRDKQVGWPGYLSIVCSATLPARLKGKLATLGFRLMAAPTVGRQRYPEPLASEGLHLCRSFWSLNCSFLDTKNRFIKSLVRSLG